MQIKLFCLLTIVAVVATLTSAQKKKDTTVTGDITRSRGSGTRVDVGVSHRRGNWEFNGSGFGTSRGHRGGSVGVSHRRKNFEFSGSVFGDNRGNRGAGLGFKWRFRRSAQLTGEHFDVVVVVNHCDFDVYDKNEDDVITKDEISDLFSDNLEAERLFYALDLTGDEEITVEEFTFMAPKVINRCSNDATTPDVVSYNI